MSDEKDRVSVVYNNKIKIVILVALIPPIFRCIGNLVFIIFYMDVSDFWSFYGGYLAFLGTLFLGALTLKQNQTLSEQTTNQTNEIWKATETKYTEMINVYDGMKRAEERAASAYEEMKELYSEKLKLELDKAKPNLYVNRESAVLNACDGKYSIPENDDSRTAVTVIEIFKDNDSTEGSKNYQFGGLNLN